VLNVSNSDLVGIGHIDEDSVGCQRNLETFRMGNEFDLAYFSRRGRVDNGECAGAIAHRDIIFARTRTNIVRVVPQLQNTARRII